MLTAPTQTETAQAERRVELVVLQMMLNISGFMLVKWINYGFLFIGGGVVWRFLLAFQFIFIFSCAAIFTVFNTVHIRVIYLLYPETANRRLEDMDDCFRGDPGLNAAKEFDAVCQKRLERFVETERAELGRNWAEERKNAGLGYDGGDGK